jgi:hypothetical protein
MSKPHIMGAPGLVWRKLANGAWQGSWRARSDLVARDYLPKNREIWVGDIYGSHPDQTAAAAIADACANLQDEMLAWSRSNGASVMNAYDGDLRTLIGAYQTDPDSSWHAKRYEVRNVHTKLLNRIAVKLGNERIADITGRKLKAWHREWSDNGAKVSVGSSLMAQLRTLVGFGHTILECKDCKNVREILRDMKFPQVKPRKERLTAEQAIAIREAARKTGHFSIDLAQAFQFDLMLRQKDVIGEWIPRTEPGISDVVRGNLKWMQGLRWSEIDDNWVLRHVTSKRSKEIEVDLKLAPMVMEAIQREIAHIGHRPASGPIICCDGTKLPWETSRFRRIWRKLATAVGIPATVKNMDSRAGAISEATDAGAELEHVRHAATHSDISMTQRYSRGATEKIANVQRLRIAHRNKSGTDQT